MAMHQYINVLLPLYPLIVWLWLKHLQCAHYFINLQVLRNLHPDLGVVDDKTPLNARHKEWQKAAATAMGLKEVMMSYIFQQLCAISRQGPGPLAFMMDKHQF